MEAVAKLKNCPMSARKMRLVVDNVRGQEVDKALNILRFTRKEAATWIEKVLLSAIANWENKAGAGVSAEDYELYVKIATVDDGPMLKRFRPAPYGRAHRIRKRTNHLTLIVENNVLLPDEEEDEDEGVEELEDQVFVSDEEGNEDIEEEVVDVDEDDSDDNDENSDDKDSDKK